MSDGQTLLLVLALLYLAECLFWARLGAGVLRSLTGRKWSLVFDSGLPGNDRGNLHWASPVPFGGRVLMARGLPFAFSPAGVLAFHPACPNAAGRGLQTGRLVRWPDLKSATADGKRLLVNDALFWASDSPHEPLRWAKLLPALASLPESKREPRLRAEIAAAFDRPAVRKTLDQLAARLQWPRRLATGLFVFLFGVCPAVVWWRGWFPALLFLGPAMMIQMAALTRLLVREHRRLYPDAADDRLKLGLVAALAPAATIRVPDALTRPAVERFHPLAVAADLLSPRAFAAAAEPVWRDLQFPRLPETPSAEPDAALILDWFRRELGEALRVLCAAQGLEPELWLAAPPASETLHVSYCPRCHAQFTAVGRTCAACGGRPLLPLAK